MENTTFLDAFAQELIRCHDFHFDKVLVVLPNKRAKLFLWEALKKKSEQPFFAPRIISVEEFVSELSELDSLDTIDLLFHFYEVYQKTCHQENSSIEPFDVFANWAKMLLSDFNEIDRYLLPPDNVFNYLKNIEDIKHWSVDASRRTELIDRYLRFWELMPLYYKELNALLLAKKLGYQGMIYRKAVANLPSEISKLAETTIYFAGFNALNQAEEKIIQLLLNEKIAKVYWDIEATFLEDPYHDAGYFARKIKKSWPYYHSHPYEWIQNEFVEKKKISIVSTPQNVGQAKIVGELVEQMIADGVDLTKTAIVLGDEQLLQPVLFALPQTVGPLNITMGYKSKSNPVQLFVQKWFALHFNAFQKSAKNPVFYHKDFIEIFTNPLVSGHEEAKLLVQKVVRNNLSFISSSFLLQDVALNDPFIILLSKPFSPDVADVLERISQVIFHLKDRFVLEKDTISQTFLFSVFQTLQKVKNYVSMYSFINTIEQLFVLYKELIQVAEVSFEGEPLRGLQIMGVLESRVLDFEHVIITSVNEGVFPSGKMTESFIPYDVKREYGLPTTKEKDAIYTYHFYHLLQRAQNIHLIYDSSNEGANNGEKSRFITQLLIEPQKNHEIETITYFAPTPTKAYQPIEVEKSPTMQQELRNLAENRGFSPTALTSFIRNPIDFYFQKVLHIREIDEVEESVAANTLGTIMHNVLENIYTPFVGKYLKVADFDAMKKQVDEEINNQFKIEYSNVEKKEGKNFLFYEVAKSNILYFLNFEQREVAQGTTIFIEGLETNLTGVFESEILPYPVRINGKVDRIEIRNNTLRIIDYKTGNVTPSQLKLKNNADIMSSLKYDKAIQLLMYAYMYQQTYGNRPLEVGIFSFKKKAENYMLLSIDASQEIVAQNIETYKDQLIQLVANILNPSEAFAESTDV